MDDLFDDFFFNLPRVELDPRFALHNFDLDLVGFNCAGEIERDAPWACPFQPGCGKTPDQCPLAEKRAQILARLAPTTRCQH